MYFRLMGKLNARRNNLQQENEKGFTLIELLVVVIIIGILAAIAIPVYLHVQDNAKDSAAKSDLENAKTAIVSYETDHNGTPPTSIADFKNATYGYTPSDGVSTAWFVTAPTAANPSFTLAVQSATGTVFEITDSASVTKPTPQPSAPTE